jgi:formamidopyrimidine-DNA glycosylase
MPELPEVETIRADLRGRILGDRITGVEVNWSRSIAEPAPAEFAEGVAGRTIEDVGRHGKFLLIRLSGGLHLVVHLRMTGQLLVRNADDPPEKYGRVILCLASGRELRFADLRKFARMWLVDDEGLRAVLGNLGPDALDRALAENFEELFAERRGSLKALLLNQAFVAGLGNIYADEVLHRARLHPLRRAESLTPVEVQQLKQAIDDVLAAAIANRGTTFSDYRDASGSKGRNQLDLAVYGRTGKPCPRCETPIERTRVSQRSTHFCPRCQPLDSTSAPER